MKVIFALIVGIFTFRSVYGQSHIDEVKTFQTTLNQEFLDPAESPLSKKERKKFKGHNYFLIDENYKVVASFTKSEMPVAFQMKTSNDRLGDYDKYGIATFELNGQVYSLSIYQSHKLRQIAKYRDYLFLPFTDLTNEKDTYGGGRYIDLVIPEGDSIIIDFNKAYNPYCAYSHDYSCPIPPAENGLDIRVEAGVKSLGVY